MHLYIDVNSLVKKLIKCVFCLYIRTLCSNIKFVLLSSPYLWLCMTFKCMLIIIQFCENPPKPCNVIYLLFCSSFIVDHFDSVFVFVWS